MARSPPDDLALAIRSALSESGQIAVRVTPNARTNGIEVGTGVDGWPRLLVRVTTVPEDGKANAAVIALIAKALGLRKSAVAITRGHAVRDKVIAIEL